MVKVLYKLFFIISVLFVKFSFAVENHNEETQELLSPSFTISNIILDYYKPNTEIEKEIADLIDEKNKTAHRLKEDFNLDTLQQHAKAQYDLANYVLDQSNKRGQAVNTLRQAYKLHIPKEQLESKAFQEILGEIVELEQVRLLAQMTYATNYQYLISNELSQFTFRHKEWEILAELFFIIGENSLYNFIYDNREWTVNNPQIINFFTKVKTYSKSFSQQDDIYQDNIDALKQIIENRLKEVKG